MSDEYERHLFSYSFDGQRWSIEIPARSETEARKRLSLASMATYDGTVQFSVPADLGWFAKLFVWFKNGGRQ